jgi:hypothetical protein
MYRGDPIAINRGKYFKNNWRNVWWNETVTLFSIYQNQKTMKTYNVSIKQVSKERNRYFDVYVNGKNIGVTSCLPPSYGSDYGHDTLVENVFENAYQIARRVIIHSMNNDIDVFTNGSAKMDFGTYKITWA